MLVRVFALLFLFAIGVSARAAWEKVPPMDWSGIRLSEFADHELDLPYYLEHFHTVANAVVEEGPDRGFLAIAVNRNPEDNRPYNARIMENTAWFAYFYGTKRSWNPYYASPAVRQRLEAMLDFWVRSQSPEGWFAEYGPQKWGLPPTGFGVLHMSQTLDELYRPGAPPIDPALRERVMQAQRKAILAVFNDEPMRKQATRAHNQYTGVYRAAAAYLKLRPDDGEVRRAWIEHTKWAAQYTQSPAGYFYEDNFPDFGYSRVHDTNLQHAEPRLADMPEEVRKKLIEEFRSYNRWLAPNFVLEPDRSTFFLNAAIQNRTLHANEGFTERPFAALVPESWPFSVTDTRAAEGRRTRRERMQTIWPQVPALKSYTPRFLFHVTDGLMHSFPTEKQRDGAIAKLPYLARTSYAELRWDPRAVGVLYVRRPGYYAALNFGRSEGKDKPVLGLGLLWNDTAGTVAQALPAAGNAPWGVKLDGQENVIEGRTLKPSITVAGKPIEITPGIAELPAGEIVVTWPLADAGTKTVTFNPERIVVDIAAKGGFTEQIPLILRPGDTIETQNGRITRTRGKQAFVIATDTGRIDLPAATGSATGTRRVNAKIAGTDRMRYTLEFPK